MNGAYMDKDELVKHQNKELKKVIKYSYDNTKFYHDMFKEKDITPDRENPHQDLTGRQEYPAKDWLLSENP